MRLGDVKAVFRGQYCVSAGDSPRKRRCSAAGITSIVSIVGQSVGYSKVGLGTTQSLSAQKYCTYSLVICCSPTIDTPLLSHRLVRTEYHRSLHQPRDFAGKWEGIAVAVYFLQIGAASGGQTTARAGSKEERN